MLQVQCSQEINKWLKSESRNRCWPIHFINYSRQNRSRQSKAVYRPCVPSFSSFKFYEQPYFFIKRISFSFLYSLNTFFVKLHWIFFQNMKTFSVIVNFAHNRYFQQWGTYSATCSGISSARRRCGSWWSVSMLPVKPPFFTSSSLARLSLLFLLSVSLRYIYILLFLTEKTKLYIYQCTVLKSIANCQRAIFRF